LPTARPLRLTDAQARLLRFQAQRLAERQPASPAAVPGLVQALAGIQAQEPAAARLALRARCAGLLAPDVERARVEKRSIVRTWLLRGTLHLVAAADLAWLLALLGPTLIPAGRRRRAELGLDDETAYRGVRLLAGLLRDHGPQTRAEIAAHLAAHGIPAAGQATIHLIGLAALLGELCYGPPRRRNDGEGSDRSDGEPTFVALDGWLEPGPGLPPRVAAAELARRYLAAYGPAAPADLAAWSGLPMAQVRAAWQGIAGELAEVEIRGQSAWLLRAHVEGLDCPSSAPIVRLVPGYDPYLLGYRDRELAVPAEYRRHIHPGGGVLHPAVLVDGLAAGTWRPTRRGSRVLVAVGPVEALDDPFLEPEIADVTRFLQGQ
jgi:hypothetical protein